MRKSDIKFACLAQEIITNYKLNGQLGSLRSVYKSADRLSETFSEIPVGKIASSDFFLKHVPRILSLNPTKNLNSDRKFFIQVMNLSFERGLSKYPPRKIRKPSPPSDVGKELSKSDIRKLLSVASRDLKLQIEIGLSAGCRKREILGLKRSYFNFSTRMVTLPASVTKTRRGRRFALPYAILKQCEERFNLHQDTECLFPSPTNRQKPVNDNKSAWRNALKLSGLQFRFHDLRHTSAAMKLRSGTIPEAVILAELGMSRQVLQNIYAKQNTADFTSSADETYKSFSE